MMRSLRTVGAAILLVGCGVDHSTGPDLASRSTASVESALPLSPPTQDRFAQVLAYNSQRFLVLQVYSVGSGTNRRTYVSYQRSVIGSDGEYHFDDVFPPIQIPNADFVTPEGEYSRQTAFTR
jgi:hypothetical protein